VKIRGRSTTSPKTHAERNILVGAAAVIGGYRAKPNEAALLR
jgi:hypothetical protein